MKVLVAVPCLDMVPADFAFCLAGLMAHGAEDHLGRPAKLALFAQKGSIVMDARNACVAQMEAVHATHIFFLDSDMSFPPDTLTRLLRHNRDIVGATYVKRVEPYNLLGTPRRAAPPHPTLQSMETLPLGCCLIREGVFENLPRPYFRYVTNEEGVSISEDTWFSMQAIEAGLDIYCDMKLTTALGHIGTTTFRSPQ